MGKTNYNKISEEVKEEKAAVVEPEVTVEVVEEPAEVKETKTKISGRMIKAADSFHAMERYFQWYWRHFKEKHPSCYKDMFETTSKFGNIVVIDQKGYKKYYI